MSIDTELIEIQKEIKANGEEANKSFKFTQDTLKKQDEKLNTVQDALKGLDGVTAEAVLKAADDTTKSIAAIQVLKQEAEKIRLEQKELEKIVSRASKNGGAYNNVENNVDVLEYRKQLAGFITRGEQVDPEVVKKGASSFFNHYSTLNEKIKENMIREFSGGTSQKGNLWLPGQARDLIQKTMFSGSMPEGGFLTNTPDRRTDQLITREFETSPIRQAGVNIISTTAKSVEIVIDDQRIGAITPHGELRGAGGEINTTEPKFGLLTIQTASQSVQVVATHDFLEEAVGINPEGWLTAKVNQGFDLDMNKQCFKGDGVNEKSGILEMPEAADRFVYERFTLPRVKSGTNGVITYDGLVKLWLQPKEIYQRGAVWMIKRQAFTEVVLLKDNDGRSLINPSLLPEGVGPILFGKRVLFAEDLDSTIDSGGNPVTDAEPIVYGDFSKGYTIVERIGVRFIRDIFSDDNKEIVKFHTTKKWGGAVTNYEALAIQKLAA